MLHMGIKTVLSAKEGKKEGKSGKGAAPPLDVFRQVRDKLSETFV